VHQVKSEYRRGHRGATRSCAFERARVSAEKAVPARAAPAPPGSRMGRAGDRGMRTLLNCEAGFEAGVKGQRKRLKLVRYR
jgi:hypothetical protein